MANRVTIVIGTDGTAAIEGIEKVSTSTKKMEGEVRTSLRKMENEWELIEEAQKRLGLTTQQEKMQMVQAYKTLEQSGVASATELKRAQETLNRTLHDTNGWIERIQGSYLQIAGVMVSFAWLKALAADALEAEKAFNQLKIQIEGMGIAYESVSRQVEEGIRITSEYARVQDEDVARTLQEMILISGDYEKSLKNLSLVYDIAYQKHVNAAETARMVGMAMTGNVEMLGRYFSELRNLNTKLGDNATEAQKAAYAMAILEEKSSGALGKMTEHEKMVVDLTNAFKALGDTVGEVALQMTHQLYKELTFKSIIEDAKNLKESLTNLIDGVNISLLGFAEAAETVSEAIHPISETYITHHSKYTEGLAAGIRIVNKQREESEKKTAVQKELNKGLSAEIDRLTGEYNKLTMSIGDYDEWERKSLITKGADAKLIERLIELKKKLRETEREPVDYSQVMLSVPDYDQMEAAAAAAEKGMIERNNSAREEYLSQFSSADINMGWLQDAEKAKEAQKKLLENTDTPYQKKTDNEVGKIYYEYDEKLKVLEQYNLSKLSMMREAGASELEIEAEHTKLSNMYAEKRKSFQISAAADSFGAMSNLMQNLYVATGSKNKAMFETMKAFAIAQTVIETYKGATEAYAALASIPYVGPALGAAAAAAAIAAGMARVSSIRSTNPGSGTSISAEGVASPTYSGGSFSAYPPPTRIEDKAAPTQVTLQIINPLTDQNWKKITEENIVPALKDIQSNNISMSVEYL